MLSKTLSVFLVVYFSFDPSHARTDEKFELYNYIEAVDSYYKIHPTRRNFADAKQTCVLEGATLFFPENQKEAQAVIELWNKYQPNTNWAVYVGLTDMEREGSYKTIDGRTISNVYQLWQRGEPNNNGPGDEDCATLYRQGDMNDVPCSELYPFICKKKTNDYEYIAAVDSYYKFHTTRRTFADAKQTCVLEGASLFYPENKKEAHAVIEFWNKYQPNTNWAVYVGLTDMDTEGSYKTLDGRTISNVYQLWQRGEPNNNGPGDEDCATLYRQGDMNDVPCSELYPFICKKKNDYEYIAAVDSYYKFHTTRRTFADAKQTCVLEGATLFYPENKKEAHAVIEFWNKYQPTTNWAVYVGLTDMETEGSYKTLDGRTISNVYQLWQRGEPNNNGPGDEDCATLYRQGDMNDVPCSELYPFICKRLVSQKRNDHCNSDYTFSENVGNCYKLHKTPLTWIEAYDVCRTEHSHLAVINNALEANYLAKLMKSVGGIFHLGVHSVPNHGWLTVTGQSISDSGALWGNFVPTADDDKQCGSMSSSGLLSNTDCSTKSFFICEREGNGPTESTFSFDNEENYV